MRLYFAGREQVSCEKFASTVFSTGRVLAPLLPVSIVVTVLLVTIVGVFLSP